MHTVQLFFKIIKYSFYAQIEYPGAYLAGISAQWVSYGVEMFMLFLMIWNFGTLAGWLPAEVMFLYSIWLLTYALASTFTFNISRSFSQIAINGTMDEAFVRPMPPLTYLIATHINLGYISHISLTVVVFVISIVQLNVSWSIFHWLWLGVLVVSGSVITGCMMLICEMPAMRTRSQSPTSMLFWDLRIFSQYPLVIYPRPIQFIFTAVLPYAFINFYPTQVLLGKQDGLFAQITMWLSPFVALILIAITALCWQKICRGYESAGT